MGLQGLFGGGSAGIQCFMFVMWLGGMTIVILFTLSVSLFQF